MTDPQSQVLALPTYHLEVGTSEGWTWKAFEHIHQLAMNDRMLRDQDGNRLDFNWSMEAWGCEPEPTQFEQFQYALLDSMKEEASHERSA